MTRDELVQYVRASRAAQGLPEQVTDPAVLARVAALIDVGGDR